MPDMRPSPHTTDVTGLDDRLTAAGLGDPEMLAIMGWEQHVTAMVRIERELARALGSLGIVAAEAAEAAASACDVTRLDMRRLLDAAPSAATPVIPLVAMLLEQAPSPDAGVALHRGATSQDIIDTATMLQLRTALEHLDRRLLDIADRCADLATRHADAVMAGRTLGQHAVPITFGLLSARWLAAVDRRIAILRRWRSDHLVVQLGGAAGTMGGYGTRGLDVAAELASRLGLGMPTLPLHAERDHIAELAGALATTAGVVGKIAGDLLLLAATDVGEVRFVTGGPTSSAMPHKQNPVDVVAARAAARLAIAEAGGITAATPTHELERAAGAWQAEWVALPSLLSRTAGATLRLDAALAAVAPDTERMRRNLELGLGLTASEALAMALSEHLDRDDAARNVARLTGAASASGRTLGEVAEADAIIMDTLGVTGLRAALDPAATLTLVPELIARALSDHAGILSPQP